MERRFPHFIAILKYRTTEEGGRKTPARSGYRPQLKFSFEEMQTSGQQVFNDKKVVYPGDTVKAEITMASPKIFRGRLSCGMAFEFREGARIIGTGQIIEILNSELNIKAKSEETTAGLSESDKKLLDDVEQYGWHVVKVMGDDTGPGFGYSVGFFKTFGQPELIIIGLKLDLIHSIINDIGEDLRNGRDYKSDRFYSGLIEGHDCYFITVNVRFYFEYVGYARWFYKGDSFPLLQCVYPTKKNIYPWQKEWPKEISNLQPILGEDGVTFP